MRCERSLTENVLIRAQTLEESVILQTPGEQCIPLTILADWYFKTLSSILSIERSTENKFYEEERKK